MKPLLFTICSLLLSCSFVSGQYKQHQPLRDYYIQKAIGSERVYQRISVGIGKPFFPGTIDLKYKGTDTSGNAVDFAASPTIHAKSSIVVHAGTFFPIALLSDRSMLVLNTEVMATYMELGVDSVEFSPGSIYRGRQDITMIGVPLSLDFKSGADVSLNKSDKTMFTFGGGFNFCGYNNYATKEKDLPVKAIPFVKAEVGFVAGLAFKLRAMAHLGKADFIDRYTGNVIDPNKSDELYSKSNTGYGFNLSLVIMPFSYNWQN